MRRTVFHNCVIMKCGLRESSPRGDSLLVKISIFTRDRGLADDTRGGDSPSVDGVQSARQPRLVEAFYFMVLAT
jgi:hypothetical protein